MQTRFVDANGLRFEVLEQGSGDRLALLLHGFPEHAISWRHRMPVLAGMGYRVWAVNQRGYGRTTRPGRVSDYALPQYLFYDKVDGSTLGVSVSCWLRASMLVQVLPLPSHASAAVRS